MAQSARRTAAALLRRAGAFPRRGSTCLEIGYGNLGWLATLLDWGLKEADLHGIELILERAERAQEALPGADLRVGDACELPWADGTFSLIVASTVFSSVLDVDVRRKMALEAARCLAPGGALLWYDLAFDNPWNRNVRGLKRRELSALFPSLAGSVRRVTLAPPLARLVAPRSWALASCLEGCPFLRTHLIAVLTRAAA